MNTHLKIYLLSFYLLMIFSSSGFSEGKEKTKCSVLFGEKLLVQPSSSLPNCEKTDDVSDLGGPLQEKLIKGILVSIDGPLKIPLSEVLRESPSYAGARHSFKISMKNETKKSLKIPFEELRRNIVIKYVDIFTGRDFLNNKTPPPKLDGSVIEIAPNKVKTFDLMFEYPKSIASIPSKSSAIKFCVKWESHWLRKINYNPGSYEWNESFQICKDVQIYN